MKQKHPFNPFDTRSDPHEVDHFRNRVRLYLQVMLLIDVLAYVSDFVTPFFVEGLPGTAHPGAAEILGLRLTLTFAVAVAWAFTRFAKPKRAALIAIEIGVTIGLALMYIHLASIYLTGNVASYAPLFTMFGVLLLLSVRAALVPSPVLRTALIGAAAVVSVFVKMNDTIRTLDPTVLDGLSFIGGAFVIATAVTSHVIYGLRREVRRALQLGQYTLEEKLGEGGMGTVYRARHALLRRQAAIKLIKPEPSADEARRAQAMQRFEREADVTATLKSPHTVELYDFGVSSEGAFYYVMELLDGVSLETAVSTYGPMPPGRAVFVLQQVCESLEEAHAAGLVHRDIKPANILLCHHGLRYDFAKVLDFGLVALDAKREALDAKLTTDGFAGGTPAYLAPEMVSNSEAVDGRADLYAMGCVAYWLLTGHAPFERDTAMATILAHVNDAPLPPSVMSEIRIPKALDTVVLQCLAKNPADRPASAAELAERLVSAVGANAWNHEQAAHWWTTYKPSRQRARTPVDADAAQTLTKALS